MPIIRKGKRQPVAPKLLSEAIELALEDLRIVEKHKDYTVDMSKYHRTLPWSTKCHVCFAGVVMTVTHETPWRSDKVPHDFSREWRNVFTALDNARQGFVLYALEHMSLPTDNIRKELRWSKQPIYAYEPVAFKRAMKKLAKELKEAGV